MNGTVSVQKMLDHLQKNGLVITTVLPQQKYISGVKNLANYLGMPQSTVRDYVANGILPKRKLGLKTIFNIKEVDAAISGIE